MERKAKLGISALKIIGIIYSCIGGVFALLGGAFLYWGSGSPLAMVGSVFALLGGIFLVLGLVFLLVELRRKRCFDALIEGQRYIWAEVVDVAVNRTVQINGRSPIVLTARYTDPSGREHTFRSRNIRHYRDQRLIGKQVRIYIRDEGYSPYYMDAEPLIPQTIEH